MREVASAVAVEAFALIDDGKLIVYVFVPALNDTVTSSAVPSTEIASPTVCHAVPS